MEAADVATAGSNVLLDINNGERFIFSRLTPTATLKLGKQKYSLSPLIGSPLGSSFEPKGSSLYPRARAVEDVGEEEEDVQTKDNRNLVDDNTAQTLSAEEINSMKRDGSSGHEIINALIANSTSFESKTAFAQEKYKRKKQKKYAPSIVVRRPTARSVCEAYFAKTPAKIGYLRMDSLSLILSLANVGDKCNVLVIDTFGGLLTAAAAERMSGFGTVCNVYYTAKPPSADIVGLFNFDATTSSRIFRVPLSKLLKIHSPSGNTENLKQGSTNEQPMEVDATTSEVTITEASKVTLTEGAEVTTTETLEVTTTEASEVTFTEATDVTTTEVSEVTFTETTEVTTTEASEVTVAGGNSEVQGAIPVQRSRVLQHPSDEQVSEWLKEGFTSLIIGALNVDPLKALQQLLPLLAPSSPFVVYHSYMQPLAECMFTLQKERMAVSLQLSEPWLREYQILPSRTHPHMQMSATGGYILSGIRVLQ